MAEFIFFGYNNLIGWAASILLGSSFGMIYGKWENFMRPLHCCFDWIFFFGKESIHHHWMAKSPFLLGFMFWHDLWQMEWAHAFAPDEAMLKYFFWEWKYSSSLEKVKSSFLLGLMFWHDLWQMGWLMRSPLIIALQMNSKWMFVNPNLLRKDFLDQPRSQSRGFRRFEDGKVYLTRFFDASLIVLRFVLSFGFIDFIRLLLLA